MLDRIEGCQVPDEHPIERQAQQKKRDRPAEDGGQERNEGCPDERHHDAPPTCLHAATLELNGIDGPGAKRSELGEAPVERLRRRQGSVVTGIEERWQKERGP